MLGLRFIFGLALLIFLVTLGLKNMEPQVTIQYWFGYAAGPMPFFFALLCAAVAGILFTLLFAVFEQLRLHSVIRKQRRQIAALEGDLAACRQAFPEKLIDENLNRPAGGEPR